jgi:iron-sulfur cluster repair protein YtfE (RIC family)
MPKVHTMFRREFGLLPGLVRGVKAGDIARSLVVADHFEFLCTVLETHHQSEDESLWPKLLDRGDEEVASVVHLMEGHHDAIGKSMSEVLTELVVWLGSAA